MRIAMKRSKMNKDDQTKSSATKIMREGVWGNISKNPLNTNSKQYAYADRSEGTEGKPLNSL